MTNTQGCLLSHTTYRKPLTQVTQTWSSYWRVGQENVHEVSHLVLQTVIVPSGEGCLLRFVLWITKRAQSHIPHSWHSWILLTCLKHSVYDVEEIWKTCLNSLRCHVNQVQKMSLLHDLQDMLLVVTIVSNDL